MITEPHKTQTVVINEQEIPVWVYGSRKNLPIMFLHGFPVAFSELVGDLPIPYLDQDYQIIAFDLPGFGKSKHSELNPIDFIAEIIKNVIPDKQFVIFGTSYGGVLALEFARKDPENVKGIIIAGTPMFGMSKLYTVAAATRMFRSTVIPVLRSLGIKKQSIVEYIEILKDPNINSILKNFKFLSKKHLSTMKLPVLLLYSSKDRVATKQMGIKLSKCLPNSKLCTINDRTHGWLLHKVDENEFLPEIKKFLKEVI